MALIQGGTLPIMSLTSLHFYIQFNDNLEDHTTVIENKNDDTEYQTQLDDKVEEFKTEEIVTKKYKKESDTILDSTNPNDPKRYIKKTDTDYRASKGIKSGRPQKNWGK